MATVLHFPLRPPATSPVRAERSTGEVVILPCIRREPIGMARAATDVLEQMQA